MTKERLIEQIKEDASECGMIGAVEIKEGLLRALKYVEQLEKPKWHEASELPSEDMLIMVAEKHKESGKIYTGFGRYKGNGKYCVSICTEDFEEGFVKDDFDIIAWREAPVFEETK